jgi:hypothetical protein
VEDEEERDSKRCAEAVRRVVVIVEVVGYSLLVREEGFLVIVGDCFGDGGKCIQEQ